LIRFFQNWKNKADSLRLSLKYNRIVAAMNNTASLEKTRLKKFDN